MSSITGQVTNIRSDFSYATIHPLKPGAGAGPRLALEDATVLLTVAINAQDLPHIRVDRPLAIIQGNHHD